MSGLMQRIWKQARAVPFDIDSPDALAQFTFRRNPDAEAAIQYLTSPGRSKSLKKPAARRLATTRALRL
jgi:hypothetical protein